MEKSFEIRFPLESDYEKLKQLWHTSFDDSGESLDSFFKNTVSPDRVLAVFDEKIPVSALYMLESEVLVAGKSYSAYYIYAVCTHPQYRGNGLMKSLFEKLFQVAEGRGVNYVFLVPEEKYLFKIYEKIGFETGFSYSENIIYKKDFDLTEKTEKTNLTYEEYRECVSSNAFKVPFAVLEESTFKSFFNSVSGEVKTAYIKNKGYALYEETAESLTVYELCGDEKMLLKAVFQNTPKESLIYRKQAKANFIPYGMYKIIKNAPKIENGFFGIPYST